MLRSVIRTLGVIAIACLAGCTSLPAGSPTIRELSLESSDRAELGVELFEVDDRVADILAQTRNHTWSDTFATRRSPASPVIGVGDVLQVSIWEPSGSGLFGARGATGQGGAQNASLQPLAVERDGFITIPFAGRVQVGSLTIEQARLRIEERLRANAIQPQVMLTVIAQNSHIVSVGGEVGKAGVIPLSARGDRVLDVIAAAGGAKHPAFESIVKIRRGNALATISLKSILDNPNDNIYVQRGDSIYVNRQQRSFSAFGATGKSGHYPFDADTVLLTEAVAKAGGLVDSQADLSGVLLFRHETGQTLAKLHPRYQSHPDQIYPTVYKLDWKTARGILYARRIRLRDKDTILIANADGAQLLKLLALLKGASGIVSDFTGNSSTSQ